MTLVYWEINGIFTCLRLRLVVFFLRTSKVLPACHISPSSRHFRRWCSLFSPRIQDMLLYFPWRGPNINESVTKNKKLIATMMGPISTSTPPPKKNIQPWIWIYKTFHPQKKMPRIPHESTHQPSTINPLPPAVSNGSEHPGWLQLRGWLQW